MAADTALRARKVSQRVGLEVAATGTKPKPRMTAVAISTPNAPTSKPQMNVRKAPSRP